MMPNLQKAIKFAKKIGRKDPYGHSYFEHADEAMAIALRLGADELILTVVVLYGLVDSCAATVQSFESHFDQNVILALADLTQGKTEILEDYLDRVKSSLVTRTTKIAWLTHRMNISDEGCISPGRHEGEKLQALMLAELNIGFAPPFSPTGDFEAPDEVIIVKDYTGKLYEHAFSRCNRRQIAIFWDRYVRDLTFAEIATREHISVERALQICKKARTHLMLANFDIQYGKRKKTAPDSLSKKTPSSKPLRSRHKICMPACQIPDNEFPSAPPRPPQQTPTHHGESSFIVEIILGLPIFIATLFVCTTVVLMVLCSIPALN